MTTGFGAEKLRPARRERAGPDSPHPHVLSPAHVTQVPSQVVLRDSKLHLLILNTGAADAGETLHSSFTVA